MKAGGDRQGQPLRMMPAGGARLALERMELTLADKRIALGLLRTGVSLLGLPVVVLTVIAACGAPLRADPLTIVLAGLLAACASVGAYMLGRAFDSLAALDQQLATLRRRPD